jgi:hypothetical protein
VAGINYPHAERPGDFRRWIDLNTWLLRLHDAFRIVKNGKLDCVTEVTLTANAATTVLTHILLAPESWIDFDPTTANAAAEKAAGTMYVLEANRSTGSFTITHANNAQEDRTFKVLIIGG